VIAAATAKMCRWTGHITDFYSVASHSVAVAEICRDAVKPYALLHDAAEGYLGDVATPLKHAMRMLSPAALAAYDQVTETVDRAIHLACGLTWPVPMEIHAEVKHADLAMLATEYRDLIPAGVRSWTTSAAADRCSGSCPTALEGRPRQLPRRRLPTSPRRPAA
jgi:hypothetical protein